MNKRKASLYVGVTLAFILVLLVYAAVLYFRQKPTKAAVVFVLTPAAGFFSVFFMMMRAYLWAGENNYDFYLDHANWQYTYEYGWHDYFTTLRLWKPEYSSNYDTVYKFDHTTILNPEKQAQKIDLPNYSTKAYRAAIEKVFVVHDALKARARAYIKTIDSDYLSFYVRRGDKVIGEGKEMELHPSHKLIEETNIDQSILPVFIQTDDYSEYEFLQKRYSNRRILTLSHPSQRGSKNEDMVTWTPIERKKETEELLLSILIFSKAKHGWTDYRSNVGRFHKLFSFQNISLYPQTKQFTNGSFNNDTIICPIWSFDEVTYSPLDTLKKWVSR